MMDSIYAACESSAGEIGNGQHEIQNYFTAAAACFSAPAAADPVESAYYLCALMDAIGLTSAKCEVSGWNSSVTVSIDMNSSEARKLCAQIAGHMRDKRQLFEDGWTLQITSPFSGGNSIAYCDLPK